MGNRAVITTKERKVSLYLHWNGGRDSVEAFLEYCRLKGYRAPSHDSYGWARLAQVIANYFGGGLSIGISAYTDDTHEGPGDNGIYVIDGWHIVDRVGLYEGFTEQQVYPMSDILADIDAAQSASEQLRQEFLSAIDTNTLEIRVGDKVFMHGIDGHVSAHEVVAIAPEDSLYPGLPVVGIYTDEGKPDMTNPNNYLREDSYRVAQAMLA